MNKVTKRRCLEITLKLMKKPAAKMFLQPIDPKNGYFACFPSVEQKLRQSEYRSVREWKKDMNSVWQDCYDYYGSESWPFSQIAKYIQQAFEKELQTLSLLNSKGWLEKVFELRKELYELSSNLPTCIEDNAPLEMVARKDYQPLSPEDYVYLFKSISALPDPDDRKKLQKLLKHPKNEIDLTYLPLPKLIRAQSFVKQKTPDYRKLVN